MGIGAQRVCTENEGRSPGVGLKELNSNHLIKLRRL